MQKTRPFLLLREEEEGFVSLPHAEMEMEKGTMLRGEGKKGQFFSFLECFLELLEVAEGQATFSHKPTLLSACLLYLHSQIRSAHLTLCTNGHVIKILHLTV